MSGALNDKRAKKGFTLVEVLIVVAVIAVLAAVAIPIYSSAMERSRRAVDMANAREIASVLLLMLNTGDIEIPKNLTHEGGNYHGAWVLVTKEGRRPRGYSSLRGTVYFGANKGVKVNGEEHSSGWDSPDAELAKAMRGFADIKVMSGGAETRVDGCVGWDWYIVQVYYDKVAGSHSLIIYSGMNDKDSSIINGRPNGTSPIEEWMKKVM